MIKQYIVDAFTDTLFHLRWFTPGGEIDLCGHATLASAFVMLKYVCPKKTEIRFQTLSGELMVKRQNDRYVMTFPAYALTPTPVKKAMEEALGVMPTEIGRAHV